MMTLRMLIHSFFSNNHIILNTMDFEYFSKKKKKKLSGEIKKNRWVQKFSAKVIYYFEMSYDHPSSDWMKYGTDELFSILEILYLYAIITELLIKK